jgi:hypothetical protein
MRRVMASLVAVLFGWLLILPVFAASNQSNLPLCCRKNGKHHCAMGSIQSPGSESAIATLGQKCPYLPHAIAAAHSESYAPANVPFSLSGLIGHSAALPRTEAGYHVSFHRSTTDRGPPLSSLS